MIAFQMAAKATRDALFLSSFDISALPAMVMAAAVVSVLLAFGTTRVLMTLGPARVVPLAFLVSGALLLTEWMFVDTFRRPVAVAVYFHFSGLGAVLISGFWSIVSERFDPRTAKRQIGRIAAGGTVGGLLGGILAERSAALLSITAMLPILAALHVLCAVTVLGVRRGGGVAVRAGARTEKSTFAGVKLLARTGYLRGLVALVLVTTIGEGLIDYVFKARATASFGSGESLLRFFAVFYTGVALLTVIVQAVGSRLSLERLGLGRTVALLPSTIALGGAAALVAPRLGMIIGVRGAESVMRNGLYRAGYEMLFAPLAPRQKRATKVLVDVGAVRLGDVIGGAIVQVTIVAVAVGAVTGVLLGLTIAVSLVGAMLAIRLQRGYVKALERSLLSRAGQLDLAEAREAATRTALLQTAGALGMTLFDTSGPALKEVRASAQRPAVPARSSPSAVTLTPEFAQIGELRSRDATAVRRVLATRPFPLSLVAYAVPLLAWDAVAQDVIATLRDVAPRATGQLCDRLLDPDEDFAVRRRLPLVLASCPNRRAVDGLLSALRDSRFEVRYRCGRALSRLLDRNPKLVISRQRVEEAVLSEVAVDQGVWKSHRILDQMEDESWSPVMDEMLRQRANRSLEHVFTMLALVLPRQPLKIAFRGLHTEDAHLRGTALEYLESALPDEIRKALWPFLEDTRKQTTERRSADTVLNDLLQSNASIVIDLEALRKKRRSEAD